MVKLPFLKYFCQMAKTRPYKVEFIVSIIFTNEFLQKYYFEKITLKNLIVVKKLKVGNISSNISEGAVKRLQKLKSILLRLLLNFFLFFPILSLV